MNDEEYLQKMKEFQMVFLEYLDKEVTPQNYQNIKFFIDNQISSKNKNAIKESFRLIVSIADNHHRSNNFFSKIEQFLFPHIDIIKQTFTNFEIFDIFKSNKKIILFLITESVLQIDKTIFDVINDNDYWNENYVKYFFNECKPFLPEKLIQEIEADFKKYTSESFEEKRKNGKNDQYICELIRNDSIDDFITHVNQTNLSSSSYIQRSIFETNKYLLQRNPSLIEYSAFFGSIQIFKYLFINRAEVMSSIWLYAIHGNNAEIINFLEENNVSPYDKTFNECLEEAIKCYCNDIANYLIEKYEIKYSNEIFFKYHNYAFFPENIQQSSFLFYLCSYNYVYFVEKFLDTTKINVNEIHIRKQN